MTDDAAPSEILTDADREVLRERLEADLVNLRVQDEALRVSSAPVSLDLSIGRLSRVDAMQQQQMASASRARVELAIRMTNGALRRLQAGAFGECARCGEDIGRRRLFARPATPYCRACEEEQL